MEIFPFAHPHGGPLNIRHSSDKWQGAAATQTDTAFVQFRSMAYGYRAAWKTLDTYCLAFRRERKPYNVRTIIGRWAPPTENDTEAYIRTVVKLIGLGGNENIPRPHRYRNFERLQRTALLIAAMTCVECGIRWQQVDWDAIWQGYDLAWPDCRLKGLPRKPPPVSLPCGARSPPRTWHVLPTPKSGTSIGTGKRLRIPILSFRTKRSEVKNLENIRACYRGIFRTSPQQHVFVASLL